MKYKAKSYYNFMINKNDMVLYITRRTANAL